MQTEPFKIYNGLAHRNDLVNESFTKLIQEYKSKPVNGFPNDGWDDHWARRWEFPVVVHSITSQLSPSSLGSIKIMESGSGITPVPFWLAEYGCEVTGVDFDGTLIDNWSKVKTNRGKINFQQGDMLSLPFAADSFDVSFSISAIEHTSNPLLAVQELIRVTKPGGIISFTMDIDIANSDSVSGNVFNAVQQLLEIATTPSFPFRVWSPAEVLTFTARTLRPQSKGYLGLKYFLGKIGLYKWTDQCIFFYSGVKK